MAKYRKKPVTIEAVQFFDAAESLAALQELGIEPLRLSYVNPEKPILNIETLRGVMTAQEGDYVIRGVQGELCPCKPEIFEKTYELVEE